MVEAGVRAAVAVAVRPLKGRGMKLDGPLVQRAMGEQGPQREPDARESSGILSTR